MSLGLREPSLPPALRAVAQRELGETATTRRDALSELNRRVSCAREQNDRLTELQRESEGEAQIDDKFLLRFLRCKKFDVERSYGVWVGYHRYRRENAAIFRELNATSVQHVWRSGVIGGLPTRDRKGRAVLVSFPGRWNPDEVTLEELLGAMVLQLEHLIASEETQVHGIVFIADFEGFSFAQATSLKPWYFQKMASLVQVNTM